MNLKLPSLGFKVLRSEDVSVGDTEIASEVVCIAAQAVKVYNISDLFCTCR